MALTGMWILSIKFVYSHDVEWILKQKLPLGHYEDWIAWHYEKFGIFSVKSAYRLAYNLQNGTRWKAGNSHNTDNTRNIWNLIW
jgi:hypothetical protein